MDCCLRRNDRIIRCHLLGKIPASYRSNIWLMTPYVWNGSRVHFRLPGLGPKTLAGPRDLKRRPSPRPTPASGVTGMLMMRTPAAAVRFHAPPGRRADALGQRTTRLRHLRSHCSGRSDARHRVRRRLLNAAVISPATFRPHPAHSRIQQANAVRGPGCAHGEGARPQPWPGMP